MRKWGFALLATLLIAFAIDFLIWAFSGNSTLFQWLFGGRSLNLDFWIRR